MSILSPRFLLKIEACVCSLRQCRPSREHSSSSLQRYQQRRCAGRQCSRRVSFWSEVATHTLPSASRHQLCSRLQPFAKRSNRRNLAYAFVICAFRNRLRLLWWPGCRPFSSTQKPALYWLDAQETGNRKSNSALQALLRTTVGLKSWLTLAERRAVVSLFDTPHQVTVHLQTHVR